MLKSILTIENQNNFSNNLLNNQNYILGSLKKNNVIYYFYMNFFSLHSWKFINLYSFIAKKIFNIAILFFKIYDKFLKNKIIVSIFRYFTIIIMLTIIVLWFIYILLFFFKLLEYDWNHISSWWKSWKLSDIYFIWVIIPYIIYYNYIQKILIYILSWSENFRIILFKPNIEKNNLSEYWEKLNFLRNNSFYIKDIKKNKVNYIWINIVIFLGLVVYYFNF